MPPFKVEVHQQQQESIGLFTEDIDVFGFVPYVFYMPDIKPHEIDFIHSNGGEVSHIVECFTVQLFKPPNLVLNEQQKVRFNEPQDRTQIPLDHYQPGILVSFQWLIDMVNQKQRIAMEPYIIMKIEYPSSSINKDGKSIHQIKMLKKLSGQRTRFTIRELIKIFKVVQDYPSKKNKNQVYWQRFIKQGNFPGRSVNSVNAQWQRFCHYDTIEQAIHKAYQLGMPYSTSFP